MLLGYVPKHGVQMVWGNSKGVGVGGLGGLFGGGGGEREQQTHTARTSRRPKSGWEAARDEIGGGGKDGRERQTKHRVLLTP